jgi:VanZ family protein
MNTKLTRYLALLIYMAVLAYMSLVSFHAPGEEVSVLKQVFENLMHVPAYAVLTFLWVRSFGEVSRKTLLRSAAIAMAYGILMEFLQGLTPDRTPSLMDVGLNAIGVGIVVAAYKIRSSKAGREKKSNG